jgi:amino acid transporter
MNEAKPSIVLNYLLLCIIFGGFLWCEILLNKKIELPPTGIILSVYLILVIVINYFSFHRQDKWRKEAEKFKRFSKKKIIIWDAIVVILVFSIIAAFFYTIFLAEERGFAGIRKQ